MLQDIATVENKYKLFIERAATSKLVWGLKSKKGWANSHSNDNAEIDVVPFWSDRAYAKVCAKDEWRSYMPVEISLAEFLENWCVGMSNDGILVGVNWDANMFGKETNALSVALDILNKLNLMKSAITFSNYSSITEFVKEINEALD
jgi:hypothetical protein